MSRYGHGKRPGDNPNGAKRQWVAVGTREWEWLVTPWHHGCWVSLRRIPNGQPWWERVYPFWIAHPWELMEYIMDDFVGMLPGNAGGGSQQFIHEAFAKDYPRLWWMLTTDRMPDKSPRKRASMSLSVQPDGWCVFLNDKQSDHYICRSGATAEDCIAAIELALEETPVVWRTNGKPGKRR